MTPSDLVQLRGRGRRVAGRAVLAVCCLAGLAVRVARGDANGDYNLVLEFFDQERWSLAERQCRAFIADYGQHPRIPTVRMLLGQTLVNQKKFTEARDAYRVFVAEHADLPDVALARFRVAESSYFLEDDAAARDELQQYLMMHADHELATRAHQYLGDVQLRLGDARSAAASYQRVLDKTGDAGLTEQATFGLAQSFARLDRSDDAEALYRRLASGDGEIADDARFRLGALYFEKRDFSAAAAEFAALSATRPDSPLASVAELNAGYAQYYLSDFDAAVAHFERAAADPQYTATAGFWKGLSYKKSGDYDAAVVTLTSTYELDRDQPLAEKLLFHIGDSELRRSNFQRAQEALESVADRWPASERADDALHLATEAALRRDDLDAAEVMNQRFERDYAASGSQWLQRVLAGRIRLARGDALRAGDPDSNEAVAQFQSAVAILEQVIANSSVARTQSLARLQLARAFERLSDAEAVVRALAPVVNDFEQGGGEAEFADGLLLQSEHLLKVGRFDDAARVAQLYLDSDGATRSGTALALQAAAWSQSGDREQLNSVLDRLVDSGEDMGTAALACYEAAEVAYDARQWDWAAELFLRTVALGAESGYHAAALSGLGYSQHEAGRHQEAAAAFATVSTEYPDDLVLASTAAHMRALSLRLSGDEEAAARAYLDGLERHAIADSETATAEERAAGLNAYRCAKGAARMFRELQRVSDADAAYQAAWDQLKHQPEQRREEEDKLINEWALLHYESEDYQRSDELFSTLVSEHPESDLADDARLYLAESRFFAGDLAAARVAFEELNDAPRADEFVQQRSLLLLLDVLAEQKEWRQLLSSSERFITQFARSDDRWYAGYRAGEAALELDELPRAVQELSDVLDRTPQELLSDAEWTPSLYLLLAEAHLREKSYTEMEGVLTRFRDSLPESPFLYQADEILGRSYKNRAMFPEAREAFARVTDSETGRYTETAAKAQFHIAETLLIEKNYEAALAEYYKVYVNYQFPQWQAPALFQAGQCDQKLEDWDGAVKSYEALIEKFPESEYAARAEPLLEQARTRANS